MELTFTAVQLFDDYFYVGHQKEGFHILKTEKGLVIFEAMEVPDADEKFLIPGLKALGLEEERINTIFLTHGHFDHYLGADHVWRRTGCDVAMSAEDIVFMVSSMDNRYKDPVIPRITRLLKDGETVRFGSHTVYVMGAPGHTPGCLNYVFPVHHHGQEHRVIMFGGFGLFGPGRYPEGEYPETPTYAVQQACDFAATCVKSWECCKQEGVDIYVNPHPHLCRLLELAKMNADRGEGEENALVIGTEGVRGWLLDRYEACLESIEAFTDIRRPYTKAPVPIL